LTKIKKTSNEIKDVYMMQDDALTFDRKSDSMHIMSGATDLIKNSLSSKEHIVPMGGVTFMEAEKSAAFKGFDQMRDNEKYIKHGP
jgi:hypothetical protein